ncbi:MAG: choice-of-anchor D domain-containing protein [Bacteroidota bacterium]
MKILYTIFAFLVLHILPAQAQEVRTLARQPNSSFEGRHFYVGFMDNASVSIQETAAKALQIYIATSFKTTVKVSIPDSPLATYSLPADTVLVLSLPQRFEVDSSEAILTNKSIEITSDAPICVYSFNSKTTSSDIYNAISTSSWGMEYIAVSLPNDTAYSIQSDPHCSEFMIMAAEDNTSVTIIPNDLTLRGKGKGIPFIVKLQRGEVYLVKSSKNLSVKGDLSGSIVRSDKPIGFLSGHMRTSLPQAMSASKDHLVEMLPPTSSWGKKFVTIPFFTKYYVGALNTPQYTGDLIHVVNSLADTKIINNPLLPADILFDFPFAYSFGVRPAFMKPAIWEWNKPVCLSQIMYSEVVGYQTDSFDPSLAVISPVEQYISRTVFLVPETPQYLNHFVNFICDSIALDNARLDGALITTIYPNIKFQYVGSNPRFYWAAIPLKEGKHILSTDIGKFSGVLYGMGPHDSYATTLGFSLLDPKMKGDSIPPLLTANESCGIITAQAIDVNLPDKSNLDYISVLESQSENYSWIINYPTPTKGEITAQPIDPFKDGKITIEARDRAGNGTQYVFEYNAPLNFTSQAILFKSVNTSQARCIDDSIVNTSSTRTLTINGIGITGDPRITFKEFPVVPISLPPNTAYHFTLCYTPGAGGEKVESEVIVDFGCSRFKKIPVSGSVRNISLATTGHDFRDVRVGDTAIFPVTITNTSVGLLSAIRIDSLKCVSCTADFSFDTTGVFPISLAAGKTLSIPGRFTPTVRGVLTNTVSAANTPVDPDVQQIDNKIEVMGRGIAPEIEANNIDFKRRRVGTKIDSMIIIRNNGDAPAVLSFKSISTDFLKALVVDTVNVFPFTLLTAPPKVLKVSFTPDAVGDFRDSLGCLVDWRFHAPVNIAYFGTGTLPIIVTDSIEFAGIEAGMQSDTTAAVIFSKGNEDLTIQKIFPVSGDLSVFTIAPEWFDGRVIEQEKADSLKVLFSPLLKGTYSAVYGVIHDAVPANYPSDTSYIEVRGTALSKAVPDTAFMKVESGVTIVEPCNPNSLDLKLMNTGNIPVVIDSLSITSDNAEIDYAGFTDQGIIAVNSFKTLPVSLRTELRDSVTLFIYIRLIDTNGVNEPVVIRQTIRIAVRQHSISLETEPTFEGTPGEIINILEKGVITGGTDQDYTFKSTLTTDRTLMLIAQTTGKLIVKDAFKERTFAVRFEQNNNIVTAISENPIRFDAPSTWTLAIPFEIMLGLVFETDLEMSVDGNQCYTGDSANSKFYVVGVCSPYTRRVRITEEFAIMSAYPNPASTDASIDIMMPENGELEVTATDMLGNLFFIERNLYLTKGVHSRKLDITELPSGVYTLAARFKTDIQHSLIIITK